MGNMSNVKRITALCFIAVILMAPCKTTAGGDSPSLAIVTTGIRAEEAGPYQEAIEGFQRFLVESALEIDMKVYNIDAEDYEADISRIREAGHKVIWSLGHRSTSLMHREIDEVPVVFSMVLDPLEHGFVENLERPGGNLTGIALNIPPAKQFSLMKEVFPDFTAVGVIYDPLISVGLIEEARRTAGSMGISLIEKPISELRELAGALESLQEEGADALWAIPDRTVYTQRSLRQVLLFSLRNDFPVIGYSESFVRAGAILGVYVDFRGMGSQAAGMLARVLGSNKPSQIAVAFPENVNFSLNRRVIDSFEIDITAEIFEKADKIYD